MYCVTGETWTTQMIYLLRTENSVEKFQSEPRVNKRVFIDVHVLPKVPHNNVHQSPYERAVELLGQERLLKSHAHAKQLPKPVFTLQKPTSHALLRHKRVSRKRFTVCMLFTPVVLGYQ